MNDDQKIVLLREYDMKSALTRMGFKFYAIPDDEYFMRVELPDNWKLVITSGTRYIVDSKGLLRGYLTNDEVQRYSNGEPKPYNFLSRPPIVFRSRYDVRKYTTDDGFDVIYFGSAKPGLYEPDEILYVAGKIDKSKPYEETKAQRTEYETKAKIWGLGHFPSYNNCWLYWDKERQKEEDFVAVGEKAFKAEMQGIKLLGKKFVLNDLAGWEKLCDAQKDSSNLSLIRKVVGALSMFGGWSISYDEILDYIFYGIAYSGNTLSWVFNQITRFIGEEGKNLEKYYYADMHERSRTI